MIAKEGLPAWRRWAPSPGRSRPFSCRDRKARLVHGENLGRPRRGPAQKLGMSEYARGFVENRIDLSVLPSLTDNIWKFGVLFGDRRKMPRAMRDLGNVE